MENYKAIYQYIQL